MVTACSACSSQGSDTPGATGATHSETALPATVEPQVLQDVISAAFEVPGKEMRRAMRLLQFMRNLGIKECGGEPGPADGTYNREDQSRFPDLDLIRKKGFTEQKAVEAEDKRLEGLNTNCQELEPNLLHYNGWRQAVDSWIEPVIAAEQSATVQDQKPALARCLTVKSGATVAVADPVNEFLKLVNTENVKGADQSRLANLAVYYADCTQGYFTALREELDKSRPQFIDRNRETLDDFAAEIVAAGYVP